MKKIYNITKKRSVRRWFKQVFASFMRRQNFDCQREIAKAFEMLREIEETIEIIAREVARQAKRGE